MKELIYYLKQLYVYSGNILYFNLFGMVIVSLLDGLAILLLIPMLSISGILTFTDQSSFFGGFREILNFFPSEMSLSIILGIYIVLTIGQNLLQRNILIRDTNLQQGYLNFLKEKVYHGLLEVRWEFFLRSKKSNLINTLTREIDRVSMGIKMCMQFVTNVVFTIIQIGIAFWLSPAISSIVMICGLGLAFFSWRFVRQSKELGRNATYLSREYLAGVTENLNAIKDIKSNSLEESRKQWMTSFNQKMLREQVNFTRIQTTSQLSYKSALAIILTSFILLAVNLFDTQPETLLMVILLFGRMWPRFVTIQSNLQQLALTVPAFKVLLDLETETKNARELDVRMSEGVDTFSVEETIELQEVSFRFNSTHSTFALEDVSIEIPANQMIAIVGHSGAGKSTLVDIIMGLNKPERGLILLDGKTLEGKTLVAFRKSIGFVPQDPFLFHTTIRENLLLMNSNATDQQMWEALEFAAADDFVRRLPDGLETMIGDRGVKLSGGERQRLVLARAILRKPSLLVLDEATSALDTENEEKIQEALNKLKGKMTIIVIAHRLSTIRNSDRVIVLEMGRIVQEGKYDKLSNEREGLFNRFLMKQLEGSKII